MKNTTVITVLLVVVIAFGWLAAVLAPRNKVQSEIDAHLDQADDYLDRKLYQKAIEEYDEALKLKNDEHIWELKLDACKSLFDWNEKDFYKTYLQAAKESAKLYPMNVDFQITLADLYVYKEDYVSPYKSLSDSIAAGNKDERLTDYLFKVKYAFKTQQTLYIDYKPVAKDFYVASKRKDKYIYLKAADRSYDYNKQYLFAGPIGDDDIRLVTNDFGNYLIDGKDVIQGIINDPPEDCGIFSEGLIPIKINEKFSYYDILGDVQFNKAQYDFAGTFSNGTAAVCKDGKWFVIDKEGNAIDDEKYEDIALFQDGTYTKNDVKLLKYGGKYHLINKGEEKGEYTDVDILTEDGLIAVCQNGKWGYVDFTGEMKIEPQFMEARSFSNGLAAVFDGNNWGFINTKGELAIDYQFPDVDYFDKALNCMVVTYVEEKRTLDINEEITDGEVISETRDEYVKQNDDGTTYIDGTKKVVIKYTRYQLITLYNEI